MTHRASTFLFFNDKPNFHQEKEKKNTGAYYRVITLSVYNIMLKQYHLKYITGKAYDRSQLKLFKIQVNNEGKTCTFFSKAK